MNGEMSLVPSSGSRPFSVITGRNIVLGRLWWQFRHALEQPVEHAQPSAGRGLICRQRRQLRRHE